MKKFLTTVVSLVTIACVAFGATACGMSTDPEVLAKNLEDKDYIVVSCQSLDEYYQSSYLCADIHYEDVELVLVAKGGDPHEFGAPYNWIEIYFCKDEETAEYLYEYLYAYIKYVVREEVDLSTEIQDNVVYVGTSDAIEAAKGQ